MNSTHLQQFVKYCLVGLMNTGITLLTIFLCKSVLGVNPYISNVIGYVCGLINSFLWNKQWVFRSRESYLGEAVRFGVGFGVCYCVQFAIVWSLSHGMFGETVFPVGPFAISGYGIATLLGNVAYTICNFLYNKIITFKA